MLGVRGATRTNLVNNIKGPQQVGENRRSREKAKLRGDLRRLRKAFRQAPEDEKPALKEMRDNIREHIKTLRRVECQRRDRRRREKERIKFTKKPKYLSVLLGVKRSGVLKALKEGVEEHLCKVHSDPRREEELNLEGKLCSPEEPIIFFDEGEPRGLLHPKAGGLFQLERFRTISLLNVEGKVFFGILAKRLTQFLINNKYIDTSVQKGGVPGVPGCIEHNSVISKIIEDAKRNHGDLAVLWLDLTNTYGTVPHKSVDHTLRAYHVPQRVRLLLGNYFGNFKMRFTW
ncbi:hypothetical protein DPEC_G00204780 [Dallia pectoralis]|uniref:Uncharacterized protein n=1 Tax=Dallia pectoralis TaxID=75939 RepID=A0ACC2G3W0_DALPE|nr:hypothetical protein DPEC_G00204780 [Dallia pectoralis]